MHISRLSLQAFRNHEDSEISWGKHVNILTGPNGAGKTNILDAIHYLCMSRSFVATSDQYVVKQGFQDFRIEGEFFGEIRSSFSVQCTYGRGEGKKIFVNRSPLDRILDLIGMVPVVTLSPDDKRLTAEGPIERRSFLDSFICQLFPSYLKDLMDYRRIIKQRNQLLSNQGISTEMKTAWLEPWNVLLVETGSRIISKRTETLSEFENYLTDAYTKIARIKHKPGFIYKTLCDGTDGLASIKNAFNERIAEFAGRELEREQTLIGPQRDDLVFYLDEFELRKFGSQGQHRLFALSLKLAQLYYYSDHLEDTPILLLDDVFGDLDPQKIGVFLEMLVTHPGQTFITSANPDTLLPYIDFENTENRHFQVQDGKVEMVSQ